MMKLLLIMLVAVLYCSPLLAQQTPDVSCPTIAVTGPAGIPRPGQPVTFTASVDAKGELYNVQYVWTISDGTILRGQGTTALEVEPPTSLSMAATITFMGLPEGCPNSVSESMHIESSPQAVKLDEFTAPISKIEPARIESIRRSIEQNPDARYIVFVGFDPKNGDAARRKRIGDLENVFHSSFYEHSRLTFIDVVSAREFLQIWIVPAGADMPEYQG